MEATARRAFIGDSSRAPAFFLPFGFLARVATAVASGGENGPLVATGENGPLVATGENAPPPAAGEKALPAGACGWWWWPVAGSRLSEVCSGSGSGSGSGSRRDACAVE